MSMFVGNYFRSNYFHTVHTMKIESEDGWQTKQHCLGLWEKQLLDIDLRYYSFVHNFMLTGFEHKI